MNIVRAPIDTSRDVSTTLQAVAKINDLCRQAMDSADNALACARQAGQLLLEVKSQLPHGQFIRWLGENVAVSPRQAQRYMAFAQGKEPAVKQLFGKNDTMSHLLESLAPDEYAHIRGRIDNLCSEFFLMPINETFVHTAYIVGKNYEGEDPERYCDFSKRGVSREFLLDRIKHGMYPLRNAEIIESFPMPEGITKNPFAPEVQLSDGNPPPSGLSTPLGDDPETKKRIYFLPRHHVGSP
jgi:hypothetical protein